MTVNYDKLTDTLYITFYTPSERAEYVEVEGGILRVDPQTKQIAGVTIPSFREKMDSDNGGTIVVPDIGPVPFTEHTAQTIRKAMGREKQGQQREKARK